MKRGPYLIAIPVALSDARRLVADAELAAAAPASLRHLAWAILTTASGRATRQARPANQDGGPY